MCLSPSVSVSTCLSSLLLYLSLCLLPVCRSFCLSLSLSPCPCPCLSPSWSLCLSVFVPVSCSSPPLSHTHTVPKTAGIPSVWLTTSLSRMGLCYPGTALCRRAVKTATGERHPCGSDHRHPPSWPVPLSFLSQRVRTAAQASAPPASVPASSGTNRTRLATCLYRPRHHSPALLPALHGQPC